MHPARVFVVVLLVGALAGCQKGGPPPAAPGVEVGGRLLNWDGSPVTGGTLVLRPANGIHGASAVVQKDGSFTLTDPAGKRAVVPGTYHVFVRLNAADPALRAAVNKRYQDTEDGDSDVTVEITSADSNLVIQLKQ